MRSSTETVLQMAGQIEIWVVALVSWAFVVRYSWRTWWRTEEGRHLMSFTCVYALLFTLTGLFPFLNIPAVVALGVQVVALALALAVIVWRHLLLTDAEREASA